MKRIFSIMVAVIMVLALGVTALAVAPDKTVNVTITPSVTEIPVGSTENRVVFTVEAEPSAAGFDVIALVVKGENDKILVDTADGFDYNADLEYHPKYTPDGYFESVKIEEFLYIEDSLYIFFAEGRKPLQEKVALATFTATIDTSVAGEYSIQLCNLGVDSVAGTSEENHTINVTSIPVKVVCGHTGETEVKNAAEANCGNSGYTGDVYCKDCGEKIADGEVIEANGKHVGGTATCKEQAACEICGNKYGELAAHKGGTATCKTKAVCEVCGDSYGELDAANHEVKEPVLYGVVEATCTTPGFTGNKDYLCCGQTIPGSTTPKNPDNHGEHGTKVINAVAPDCKNDGYTGDTACEGCGKVLANGTAIPATGNHGGGEANCQKGAICAGCGTEYTKPDPDVHVNTEVRDAKEATCGEDGYTGDTYCKDCGAKVKDGEVIPATGEHKGGSATCSTLAECSVCKQPYGEYNPEVHEKEYSIVKEPTCTEVGERAVTCKCGTVLPSEEIEALGHEYGKWVVIVEATRTEEGIERRECERCDHYEERSIPKVKDPENSIIIDLNGKGQTGEESNPNTGAPVFGVVALAACAVAVIGKKH